MLLNDQLEVSGVYDSGSNVTLINSKLLKIKQKVENNNPTVNLKTINGVNKAQGALKMKIRIFDIENYMDVFIVNNENFRYKFLIGLDCIKNFQLIQNENLEITQSEKNKTKNVEIPDVLGDKIENLKNTPRVEKINSWREINFNEYLNTKNFTCLTNHLQVNQKLEIDKLIKKYNTVFAKDKYDVGTVKDYEAHIDLIEDKYCYKRPYRCTVQDRREIEDQIRKLLNKKLIEESYSPFAAPVTLAYKKEEQKKSRLCIDL